MIRCHRFIWLLPALGLVMAPALFADPALEERLTNCARVAEEPKRLECFDAILRDLGLTERTDIGSTVPKAGSKENKTDIKQDVMRSKREGEEAPHDNFGKRERDKARVDSVSAQVARVSSDARGKVVVAFESGQVWQQLDSDHVALARGDKVTIRRGAFNSFFLQPEGSNVRIRVRRVE